MDRTHSIVPWKQTVIALLLFGTAFGCLEAAVVSHLRFLMNLSGDASSRTDRVEISSLF